MPAVPVGGGNVKIVVGESLDQANQLAGALLVLADLVIKKMIIGGAKACDGAKHLAFGAIDQPADIEPVVAVAKLDAFPIEIVAEDAHPVIPGLTAVGPEVAPAVVGRKRD